MNTVTALSVLAVLSCCHVLMVCWHSPKGSDAYRCPISDLHELFLRVTQHMLYKHDAMLLALTEEHTSSQERDSELERIHATVF